MHFTRRSRLGIAALALVIILAVVWTVRDLRHPAANPYPGHPAPDFSLTAATTAQTVSLSSYRGRPVVLNFWASWCGPCQSEQPLLTRFAKTYRGQVQFIGVNVTSGDDVAAARAFVEQHGVPYPVLLDPKGTVTQLYQVSALPTTLFVDRDGRIVARITGALDAATLEREIGAITQTGGSTSS